MLMRLVVVVLLSLLATVSAQAQNLGKRVALIVANEAYEGAPLSNPKVDAAIVGPALESIGFEVTTVLDASLRDFDQALLDFQEDAQGADVALFYFAGHGFAVADGLEAQNYLMSTSADVTASSDRVLRSGGISLNDVITTVTKTAKVALFFIDACRNDPNVRAGRSGRSLAAVDKVDENAEVFIALSTRLGSVASDGVPGQGTAFARAFVRHMVEPDLRIDDAFTKVRVDVEKATEGQQRPDILRYDLNEPIILASLPEVETPDEPDTTPVKVPVAETPSLNPCEVLVDPQTSGDRLLLTDPDDALVACRLAVRTNPDNDTFRVLLATVEEQSAARTALLSEQSLLSRSYLRAYPEGHYSDDVEAHLAALTESGPASRTQTVDETTAEPEIADTPVVKERPADEEPVAEDEPKVENEPVADAEPEADEPRKRPTDDEINDLADESEDAAEPEDIEVASLPDDEPLPVDEPEERYSPRELARLVQTELNRVGCSVGQVDGDWGRRSAKAGADFVRYAKLDIDGGDPSEKLLDALRDQDSRVCPKPAVTKKATCADGQKMNSKGVCYTPSKKTAVKKKSSSGGSTRRRVVEEDDGPPVRMTIRQRDDDAPTTQFIQPQGSSISDSPFKRR